MEAINVSVSNNHASEEGGAVYVVGDNAFFDNVNSTNNTAMYGGSSYVAGLAGAVLDVAGIVKTAQGGMGMRKAVMDRKAGRS